MKAPTLELGNYGFLNLRRLRLGEHDISTHKHILGLTNQGKSKLLASLFVQLLEQGISASLIDPHSDLANEVLALLAEKNLLGPKVLFIDFTRTDRYLPFNAIKQPFDDDAVARNIVETFKRAWPALSGGAAPHFENMLLASSLVLIQNGMPLTRMFDLLTIRAFRDMSLRQVSDPFVTNYFKHRFDHWGRETADKVESTLNKVFNLTFSKTLRYTLGQAKNALNFRQIIDSGISCIYDLGGLDSETQTFLGCLLTVGYEQAALSRALPNSSRRPHHLFMDEFARFSSRSQEAMTTMLSQTRKFNVFMTMAHQNFGPADEQLRRSLGNAFRIAFRVNREDALWLAPQFASFAPETIKHEIADEHVAERSHPVFAGVQEQYEKMTVKLSKELEPRRCLVRRHHGAVEITTKKVPATTLSAEGLALIKEEFAARLMTPRDEVIKQVDHPSLDDVPPPRVS
jgi:hypothetical protein